MKANGSRKRSGRGVKGIGKPRGVISPRVVKAGPEHFGIVSVDCAKARFKWMLFRSNWRGRSRAVPAMLPEINIVLLFRNIPPSARCKPAYGFPSLTLWPGIGYVQRRDIS